MHAILSKSNINYVRCGRRIVHYVLCTFRVYLNVCFYGIPGGGYGIFFKCPEVPCLGILLELGRDFRTSALTGHRDS